MHYFLCCYLCKRSPHSDAESCTALSEEFLFYKGNTKIFFFSFHTEQGNIKVRDPSDFLVLKSIYIDIYKDICVKILFSH